MFKVDQPVVHPAHGVGVIKEIKHQVVLGKEMEYYVIEFPFNDLDRIMVPVASADSLGLRKVVGKIVIDEMLKIMADREGNYLDLYEDESFHKRHKEYLDRVQSGDIIEVTKVYKTLYERSKEKDLGLKEKFLMERAEKMLLGEISYASKISFQEAKDMIRAKTN